MQSVNLSILPPPPGDHFMDTPSSSSLWIPEPKTSIITLRSNGWTISERFESLIRQGTPKALFETPALSPATVTMTPAETSHQESNFLKSTQANLQQKIYTPEPETEQRLNDVNAKRAQGGKPPIDFVGTTKKIEDIMNNPGLSDKEKKKQVGDLRKELGLSKKDMKKLFTKRLARIYQEAANQLKTYLNQLKESAKEAEKLYGKNSAQAVAARERLQAAQTQLEPTLKKWEHQASLYKSMFPSFWSKIGGFFKAIGKGLLKVGKVFSKIMNFVTPFLRFIPGIGQMIAFGWGALKGLVQAIKGNWKGFLGGILNFTQGIPGVGSAISALSSLGSKVLPVARGLFEATRGNLTGLFQWGGSLLHKIPGVAPFLTKTSEYLSYLISPLRPKSDSFEKEVPPGALG